MAINLALLSIFVLLLTSSVMLVIRWRLPGFSYAWLIASFGALIAWSLVLLSRLNIPTIVGLGFWELPSFWSDTPSLILDDVSWHYLFAIISIFLAVLFTDVARAAEVDWSAWISGCILVALGLLSVLSGNLFAFVLTWAAIDFIQLLVDLWHVRSDAGRRQTVLAFSARALGIVFLLWAWIFVQDFSTEGSIYLLLAAWTRLGFVAVNLGGYQDILVRRSLGTLSLLVIAATGLVLLSRIAAMEIDFWQESNFLFLVGVVAFFGSFSWFHAENELQGIPYWILGASAFSIASATRGHVAASLAWGTATLLSGGLIFLYSLRNRYVFILLILGMLGFSSLVLSPTWNGVSLYSPPISLYFVLFLVSQAFLIAGYWRISRREGQAMPDGERWVRWIYLWGLLLLPLTLYVSSWLQNFKNSTLITPINLQTVLPGVLIVGLAAFRITLMQRGLTISLRGQAVIRRILSLDWVYRLSVLFYIFIGRVVFFITNILEGEGGILWALLWLVLLLALITQLGLGGT